MAIGRLAPVLGIADEALTAGDLIRHQRLWTVDADTPIPEAAREMRRRGFTVGPVTAVPITRFVRLAELTGHDGTVGEVAHDLAEATRLAESAALTDVLEALRHTPFVFVSHRHHVTGIVTRADLQQPVVGLLVLGMVLSFEAAVDILVERTAGDSWMELLSEERATRVIEMHTERRAVDADLDPLRCLNLDDRLTLARKLDLHTVLGFDAKQGLRAWAGRESRIRDHLAHGDTLLSAVPDPLEALDAVLELRAVAERAWLATDWAGGAHAQPPTRTS